MQSAAPVLLLYSIVSTNFAIVKHTSTIIKGATLVSQGCPSHADVLITDGVIARIDTSIDLPGANIIRADGMLLIPGVIDDQVHFREPGLTHKATIATESLAALAGGVTSFMEMPNVIPQTTTIRHLEEKMAIGAATSHVNYSFFLGATNNNLEDLKHINPENTCGVKIFMGSSTGDMLVDNDLVLENIFSQVPALIATHCEYEPRVKQRQQEAIDLFGENVPPEMHPMIRDEEACYRSSSHAVELAKRHNTRLHVLHITTAAELALFRNDIPLKQKRITSEVCVHHLHFTSDDYASLGHLIKCNPAIKAPVNRDALWRALLDDRLDIIATDHAPHTWEEKQNPYPKSPSGLPLVQHSLLLMLEYVNRGVLTYEKMVQKMCHAPADCFRVKNRGYIREGYQADLVLVDPKKTTTVNKENLLYKCGWSPLTGTTFHHNVSKVFVNGVLSWDEGFTGNLAAQRLEFFHE